MFKKVFVKLQNVKLLNIILLLLLYNAKKVKMVFEPPDGPCCPSKRSVQFDFMKSG